MAEPLFTSSDALLRLLDIGQEDVLANREGVLGPRQRVARRRALVRFSLASLAAGLLFLIGGFVSRGNGGQVLVPWLAAGAGLVLAALFAVSAWRGSAGSVRSVSGRAEVVAVPFGRGLTAGLQVAGEVCVFPQRMRSEIADWQHVIDPDQNYRVYLAGGGADGARPTVIAMEPAW